MYAEWVSAKDVPHLLSLDQVLKNYPSSVGRAVVKSIVEAQTNESTPVLSTHEEVSWTMQVLGHGLTLPLQDYVIIRHCVDLYSEWLYAAVTRRIDKKSVPAPLLESPEHYIGIIFMQYFSSLFEEKGAEGNLLSHQVNLCQSVIEISRGVLDEVKLSTQTWTTIMKSLLQVADKLLSPPNEPKSLGDQLCSNLVFLIFDLWLCMSSTAFPPPGLWKALRESCILWRHHPEVVQEWSALVISLTKLVIRYLYGPDNCLSVRDPKSAYAESARRLSSDALVQCWFRILHTIGNPVELSYPLTIERSEAFQQHRSPQGYKGPFAHPCLEHLRDIFLQAMGCVSTLVNMFLSVNPPYVEKPPPPVRQASSQQSSPLTAPKHMAASHHEPIKPHNSLFQPSSAASKARSPLSKAPSNPIASNNLSSPNSLSASFGDIPKSCYRSALLQNPEHDKTDGPGSLDRAVLPSKPKGYTLLHLFGSWLFEAVIWHNSQISTKSPLAVQFEEGRAVALGTMCRSFASLSPQDTGPALYTARLYQALSIGLDYDPKISKGYFLASVILNSRDLFRVGLPGVNLLLLQYIKALGLILCQDHIQLKCEQNWSEIRSASVQLLITLLPLPLHFQDLTVPNLSKIFTSQSEGWRVKAGPPAEDARDGSGKVSNHFKFISLRGRIHRLLIHALESERDSSNMQALLAGLMMLLEDSVVVESEVSKRRGSTRKKASAADSIVSESQESVVIADEDIQIQLPGNDASQDSKFGFVIVDSPGAGEEEVEGVDATSRTYSTDLGTAKQDSVESNSVEQSGEESTSTEQGSPVQPECSTRRTRPPSEECHAGVKQPPTVSDSVSQTESKYRLGSQGSTQEDNSVRSSMSDISDRKANNHRVLHSRQRTDLRSSSSKSVGDTPSRGQSTRPAGVSRQQAVVQDSLLASSLSPSKKQPQTTSLSTLDPNFSHLTLALYQKAISTSRNCLLTWDGDFPVAIASFTLLCSLAKLNINGRPLGGEEDSKRVLRMLCQYIERNAEKKTRDYHTLLVAAFWSILQWVIARPELIRDQAVLKSIFAVVELGLTGSTSVKKNQDGTTTVTAKEDKEVKPLSGRSRQMAEYLLICIMEKIGVASKSLSGQSTLDEAAILAKMQSSDKTLASFQYFMVDNGYILGLLEDSPLPSADELPQLTAIMRSPSGCHVWTMELRHKEASEKDSANKFASVPRPPFEEKVKRAPFEHKRPWPEEVDRRQRVKADESIPDISAVVDKEEMERMSQLVAEQCEMNRAQAERFKTYLENLKYPDSSIAVDPPCPKEHFHTARLFLSSFGYLDLDTLTKNDKTGGVKNFSVLNSSSPSFQSTLKSLDNIPTRYTNSVYLLYVKEGQSRVQDILANQDMTEKNGDFKQFLTGLGWFVDPASHSGFKGKLHPVHEHGSGDTRPLSIEAHIPFKPFVYFANLHTEVAFVIPTLKQPRSLSSSSSLRSVESTDVGTEGPEHDHTPTLTRHRQGSGVSESSAVANVGAASVSHHEAVSTFRPVKESGELNHKIPKKTKRPQDCAVMVVWLESLKDMAKFPQRHLTRSLHGLMYPPPVPSSAATQLFDPKKFYQNQPYLPTIFVYPLRDGLFRVHTWIPAVRHTHVGPLVDGMVISRRVLPSLVRQTALNICTLYRADCEDLKTPSALRRQKIEEISSEFSKNLTPWDLYAEIFAHGRT